MFMNINAVIDFPSGSKMIVIENFFDQHMLSTINQRFLLPREQWSAVGDFAHHNGRLVYQQSDSVNQDIANHSRAVCGEIQQVIGHTVQYQSHDLWLDLPGYEIKPHTDQPHYPDVALQIYMGEPHKVWEMLGFCIYDQNLKPLFEMHYRVNCGYILLHPDTVMHGLNHRIPDAFVRQSVYVRYQLC